MASSSEPLGLIAGSSQMPVMVAREADRAGRRVTVAAIRGVTEPQIDAVAQEVHWLHWGDLPAFFELLQHWQENGVRQAIMAGKVEQRRIYERGPGDAMEEMIASLPSGHTDQLLGAVASVLASAGIELLNSITYLQEALARPGSLAGREPDERERADIDHGWQIAKALGAHDIGQTVVVKDRAIVAVEAMEGTDACIRRAGELAGAGCVVVKVAKPDQDLRFDVPVVGRDTIASMRAARCTALAVEAELTVVFDRQEMEDDCRAAGIAAVARANG